MDRPGDITFDETPKMSYWDKEGLTYEEKFNYIQNKKYTGLFSSIAVPLIHTLFAPLERIMMI